MQIGHTSNLMMRTIQEMEQAYASHWWTISVRNMSCSNVKQINHPYDNASSYKKHSTADNSYAFF